jgi:hypothetical protein
LIEVVDEDSAPEQYRAIRGRRGKNRNLLSSEGRFAEVIG